VSRTVPTNVATHITGDVTTLTTCWAVTRKDSVIVRGTQHDRDIVISSGTFAGTYLSAAGITGSNTHAGSDLSPDNSEVQGMIPVDSFLTDLKVADIEAGLYDDAPMSIFLCNWATPDDGQVLMPGAYLGNIKRTAEGQYTAEVRGLTQRLTQPLLRTYSATCNAQLGDSRCTKNIAGLIVTATVTAVTSRRRFDCTLTGAGVAGDYIFGKLTGLTGANTGYVREVKRDAVGSTLGHLELYELLPVTVGVGDTFNLAPGCNKELATCRDRFANIANFRGFGAFTPGINKLIRGPDRGSGPA
jgi:uncharacterized phage protein (TIGR02218 family)